MLRKISAALRGAVVAIWSASIALTETELSRTLAPRATAVTTMTSLSALSSCAAVSCAKAAGTRKRVEAASAAVALDARRALEIVMTSLLNLPVDRL